MVRGVGYCKNLKLNGIHQILEQVPSGIKPEKVKRNNSTAINQQLCSKLQTH
jgi:hypothetical protein